MDGTQTSRKTFAKRARTAGALALCALAWGAAPALADPAVDYAAGSQPLQAAETVAAAYWGEAPCGGQVTVSWAVMGVTTNAGSSWANPTGQYADPTQNTSCSIVFNEALNWNWTRFCSIVVHEFGHLTGHPHVADPGNVMYPIYQGPVPACVSAAAAERATAGAADAAVKASLPDPGSAFTGLSTSAPAVTHIRRARLVAVHRHHSAHRHHHHHHTARYRH